MTWPSLSRNIPPPRARARTRATSLGRRHGELPKFLCGRRFFLRGTRLLGPLAAKSKFGAPPCLWVRFGRAPLGSVSPVPLGAKTSGACVGAGATSPSSSSQASKHLPDVPNSHQNFLSSAESTCRALRYQPRAQCTTAPISAPEPTLAATWSLRGNSPSLRKY